MEPVFKLFACCIPVKGARRSIICDVQRRTFVFIPNILYQLLTDFKGDNLNNIKKKFSNKYDKQIETYYEFLLEKELGFWCSDPEQFPDLDLTWKSPSVITNAIIDFNSSSEHNIKSISEELDSLGCLALQLRFYDEVTFERLEEILEYFVSSRLYDIQLVLKESTEINFESISIICQRHLRVSNITLHSCQTSGSARTTEVNARIISSTEQIRDHNFCGYVNYQQFIVNLPLFTESINHNNCLNKKVGIDVDGEIKNCPAMQKSFGNLSQISLTEAVIANEFQEIWDLTKDNVDTCMTCEFRYICPDCRAFTVDNGRYSKPLKCGYNPLEATWEKRELELE